MIYKPANIQITFIDESGINLSGGIGHGLILKINDDEYLFPFYALGGLV